MPDSDEGLVQYVQLEALKKSQTVLFEALLETLQQADPDFRDWFLQCLVEQIQEQLERDASDVSAHAGLLGVMMRALILDLVSCANDKGARHE